VKSVKDGMKLPEKFKDKPFANKPTQNTHETSVWHRFFSYNNDTFLCVCGITGDLT
jgi:hypothetical protein